MCAGQSCLCRQACKRVAAAAIYIKHKYEHDKNKLQYPVLCDSLVMQPACLVTYIVTFPWLVSCQSRRHACYILNLDSDVMGLAAIS